MPIVLLTGFLPFGDSQSNPSQLIVERLHGETIGEAQVVGLTLPVALGAEWDTVAAAIDKHRPILVLSLGLASGTTCLDVERFAVNLRVADAGDPDKPLTPNLPQSWVAAGGPDALFSTINPEQVAAAIRAVGVPARAHGYAGSYACNFILYRTLLYAVQQEAGYKAGFIYLPLSSEQAIAENKLHLPSLPLDVMAAGTRAAIKAAGGD